MSNTIYPSAPRDPRFQVIHDVIAVAYHRDGGPDGFYLVLFHYRAPGERGALRKLAAVVGELDADADAPGGFDVAARGRDVAVFDPELLAAGSVGSGNRWRGSNFAEDLALAVADRLREEAETFAASLGAPGAVE